MFKADHEVSEKEQEARFHFRRAIKALEQVDGNLDGEWLNQHIATLFSMLNVGQKGRLADLLINVAEQEILEAGLTVEVDRNGQRKIH